ncbi:ALKBH2 [Acanthosepion pharaonis]|uniref:DNA oxidative demethylase ALKBH2 n=1 Tax=Acanthosepion pharaonis TaxID=158019 RepID=A0A812CDQ6_ACAPH|nr:ALKBH2 [Sepia pharaonis]
MPSCPSRTFSCNRLRLSFIGLKGMDKFINKTKRKIPDEENEFSVVAGKKCSLEKTENKNSLIPLVWKKLEAEDLDCDYTLLYTKAEADALLSECEQTISYNTGQLARVQVFGKWHDIPRKQVAHGDPNLSYTFSGNTVPARPWKPLLNKIRERITEVTGYTFNFVLINRYKDGRDHMGEHKDDEKELVKRSPIASLSLAKSEILCSVTSVLGVVKARKTNPTATLFPSRFNCNMAVY